MDAANVMTPEAAKSELERFYNQPPHPIAYGNPYSVYLHFKKVLPLKEILKFIHKKTVYQKHRENRHTLQLFTAAVQPLYSQTAVN